MNETAVIDALLNFVTNEELIKTTQADKPEMILSEYKLSLIHIQMCIRDSFQECHAINEFTGLPTSEDLMRSFDEQLQLYLDGDTSSAADMLKATQDIWEPAFE